MANKPKRKSNKRNKGTGFRKFIAGLSIFALLALTAYLYYLNHLINLRFDGDTWAIPSRVYARPLELYPGLKLSAESLQYELGLSQTEPAHQVRVLFNGNEIVRIVDLASARRLDLLRLPPVVIGSYYPQNGEDRVLLSAQQIPQTLIKILLAVEDKKFYTHLGVNPKSIARALIANLKAGKTVQGGS